MSVVPASIGYQHVVSSGHELASFAALEVLENGGNAVDAGIAAILALGVLYSDQVSVAGVAPMVIRSGETGAIVTITGLGCWPRALDVDDYISSHGGRIPLGIQRTVVPAAPDACLQALERFGTMRFADVARRASQYASNGFARHQVMVDYIGQYADDYRHFDDNVDIWMPGNVVPEVGSKLIQADLGRTLQFLRDEDLAAGDRVAGLAAVRHAFYSGDIASQILRHQKDNDGLLSARDLEDFRSQLLPTVSRNFEFAGQTVRVHSCGAWCQGPGMLEALSILEAVNVGALDYGSAGYYHAIAEALKLALADREAYLGDPDFVDVPIEAMIGREYGQIRAKRIDAATASAGMPMPGVIDGYSPYISPVAVRAEPERLPADTSIVSVVDCHGNAFCSTPSDTSWDTPVVPGTGLAISSRGDQSRAVHGHPSCLAPGKRPRLTPNPCFAEVDGEWFMPFGTPGGDQQIQANVQVILSHLQFGIPLQDAIDAPRLITHSHPDSFAPHEASPGRVTIEGRVSENTCDALVDRGHKLERLADWTHWVAGVCAVKKDLRSGRITGGADPRRMSRAMGR